MFPSESERVAELQTTLGPHFDFARRLFRYWLRAPKDKALDRSRLAGVVIDLAMTMNVQACRLFRSVIEECSRAEDLSANIVCRSLFETVLVQQFILARRVKIVWEPEVDRGTGLPKKTATGVTKYRATDASPNPAAVVNWPSRELRASMYFAHLAFEEEAQANAYSRMPGIKRLGNRLIRARDPALVPFFESKVGAEWTYILREKQSYSGLSIARLAKVLHSCLSRWYLTVYGVQSGMAHAVDPFRHLELGKEYVRPRYVGDAEAVSGVLHAACAMFLANIAVMQNNIGFGPLVETAHDAFVREFRTLPW